jgi:hypothetical protein
MENNTYKVALILLAVAFNYGCDKMNNNMNSNAMNTWKETMLNEQEILDLRIKAADSLLAKLAKSHQDLTAFQKSTKRWMALPPEKWVDIPTAQMLPFDIKPGCKVLLGQLPISTGEGKVGVYLLVNIETNSIQSFALNAKTSAH